jgi:hypothetical protein
MQTMLREKGMLALVMACVLCAPASAQDANILQPVAELEKLLVAEPLVIREAQISRPKAKGDITLRAEVSFGGSPPLQVKLRKSEPGAEAFNNVPRYDLAAYELQKLFLDADEYVVPPTALRMVPLDDFKRYSPDVQRTFAVADQVLGVVQYWLNDIKVIADVYDAQRFADDAVYARHIGQLNVLTFLVSHRDSNVGNFLIGRDAKGARVFSIDHGVAFASADSDRGELWRALRVNTLPADTLERLRGITLQILTERLGVLAEWKLSSGRFVPTPAGRNLSARHGVRLRGDTLQLGLTTAEIMGVQRLLRTLLDRVDSGKIKAAPALSDGDKK